MMMTSLWTVQGAMGPRPIHSGRRRRAGEARGIEANLVQRPTSTSHSGLAASSQGAIVVVLILVGYPGARSTLESPQSQLGAADDNKQTHSAAKQPFERC